MPKNLTQIIIFVPVLSYQRNTLIGSHTHKLYFSYLKRKSVRGRTTTTWKVGLTTPELHINFIKLLDHYVRSWRNIIDENKLVMPSFQPNEAKKSAFYEIYEEHIGVLRSNMTIGTTDGRCPKSNGCLINDQQHLNIISFYIVKWNY